MEYCHCTAMLDITRGNARVAMETGNETLSQNMNSTMCKHSGRPSFMKLPVLFGTVLLFAAIVSAGDLGRMCLLLRTTQLSHNRPEAINSEINQVEFRKLIAEISKVETSAILGANLNYRTNCWLEIGVSNVTRVEFEIIATSIENYVKGRADGHTKEYMFDSLRELLTSRAGETNILLKSLNAQFPGVPRKWIREESNSLIVMSSGNHEKSKPFVVVDGEIAWIYRVDQEPRGGMVCKMDSRELDPMWKDRFELAEREARTNLAIRGVIIFDSQLNLETDKILLEKYGIKRRSSVELNPGVNY